MTDPDYEINFFDLMMEEEAMADVEMDREESVDDDAEEDFNDYPEDDFPEYEQPESDLWG